MDTAGDLSLSEVLRVDFLTFMKPKPISELCAKLLCFLRSEQHES
jgi:hypothetical protein